MARGADHMAVERIVSGGQTGVDRAALDLALEFGLDAGGWAPKGRVAESGRIPDRYKLRETPSGDPAQRTEWNVRDADATLIISDAALTGGSALTLDVARRLGRPHLHVNLGEKSARAGIDEIVAWLSCGGYKCLNIAGPRRSEAPGIYDKACALLRPVLGELGVRRRRSTAPALACQASGTKAK